VGAPGWLFTKRYDISAKAVRISQLAASLGFFAGRLVLDPERGPVNVLVVDRAAEPVPE
jgi:hypothetical protein